MRKLILTLSTVFVFILNAAAQDRTITGKVTNDQNAPVEGASVSSPDGKYGTQTKKDGSFSIIVPASVKALNISYVNFETVTRSIASSTVINTSLKPTDGNLQEVVVVGYGTQQKKAFTGSASKVDVKQFSNLVTPSVDKQLAGRAAGVQVTVASGTVNSPARIRIRGMQSISQSNSPLIIIDGNQVLSGDLAASTHSNALGDINPDDIESIDVLKDGSALAIYGARGAGGVIMITTKKGAKGRARVGYDMYMGFSSPTKKFGVLNAKDFVIIANEKRTNAGLSLLANTNPAAGSFDTDWQDLVMANNATSQSHTVSVQGGTDKTSFYLSLNYSDQKGVIINNYNKAYRVRANVEHEANRFIKLGNNLLVSRQVDGGNGSDTYNTLGAAIPAALRLLPNVSPYNPTGWEGYNIGYPALATMAPGPNAQTVDDNFNNVAYTFRRNVQNSDKYRIVNNAFLEVSPAKGLKIRSQVGIDMLNDFSYEGRNLFHGDGFPNGLASNIDQNWLRLQWTNFLNYNYSYKSHNVFVTVGNEALKTTYKWFGATGTVISDPFFINGNVITNAATQMAITGNHDETGFTAVFGRLNYDFKNKYFIQATIRRDGQSSLAPGYKYGTFPGYSAGWRISQERFWKSKIINELKIKGSYAKVGNTLTAYNYLSSFGNRPYGNISGLGPTIVGNPELQWETSAKYNVGVEAGFLNNRITLGVDWFLNDVNNLVLAVPQPLSAGIPGSTDVNGGSISQNIGTLENRGIELTLNLGIVRTKDFTWDLNANYTYVTNKVTKLFDQGGVPTPFISNGNYLISKVGEPIDIIYGYQSAGVNSGNGNPMFYKADGSMVQYNLIRGVGTVGNFYYALDKSDPNLGVQAPALGAADKVKLGNSAPTYFGAFTNSFNYKGFGLEAMFRFSGGNKIMNITAQESYFNQSFQNNGSDIINRWTRPGQVTNVPKLYYGQAAGMNQTGNANSRFVEDGDYVRLQNVVLSYTFSNAMLEKRTKGYVKSAKFYVQAQNVFVWTKYSGSDPDNAVSPLGAGIDGLVSPPLRTVSFGLSLGF